MHAGSNYDIPQYMGPEVQLHAPSIEELESNIGEVIAEQRPTRPTSRCLFGRDGRDGRDGVPGVAGHPGQDGVNGRNGEQGPVGPAGPQGPQGPPGRSEAHAVGGAVYIRWGRTTCPNTPGTERLYEGRAGGGWYHHHGGGNNYQCMPLNPDYDKFLAGLQSNGLMYGAEYEIHNGQPLTGRHDYNVPCAVCHTPSRGTTLMIPAKAKCPRGWTTEYVGYLLTAHHGHYHTTTFECIDQDAQGVPSSQGNVNGALFYHIEGRCSAGGIPCPPYDQAKELTCVVCSK